MLAKKSPKKKTGAETDFSSLDAAVSELSKQTEALLGDGVKARPNVRAPRPHTGARSFDVINPRHQSTVRSSLKTATRPAVKPSQPNVATTDASAHASKSHVDVVGHEPGKLQSAILQKGTELIEEFPNRAQVADTKSVAHESFVFTQEANAEPAQKTDEETQAVNETAVPSVDQAQAADLTTNQTAEPSSEESGELFDNNLVKSKPPKGYAPNVNQQKPTVFDTNEYHPELHDWSKLERDASLKWFVAALVLVVVAAAAYLLVSGVTIPFIGK